VEAEVAEEMEELMVFQMIGKTGITNFLRKLH
jgi:hypothetical protein